MKAAEQEAKEILTTVIKRMVCCIEKLPHYVENGIVKEVSLSEVDWAIAITKDKNKLKYWKMVKEYIKIL